MRLRTTLPWGADPNRRYRSRIACLLGVLCAAVAASAAAVDRPKWMDEPGIVMAGNWEEPTFRARRMGRLDYTLPPEKLQQYAREHSPEVIAELKELGVNFVMIHCYKGAGLKTERQGMEDSRRFAELAHRAGMRVGTYIGSTMLYERLFEEEPNARQWQVLGPHAEPVYYNNQQTFRYASVRNHPGFIEYLKKPVRYAVEEIGADLIHFDNFGLGATSYDPFTKQQFRQYLQARGKTPADPPTSTDTADPLVRDWTDYRCQAPADHYAAMSQFIRSLKPQCAVECNPLGVSTGAGIARGVDHPRLLPLGSAYWDESHSAAWSKEKGFVRTRIRSLKVGQLYDNSTFLYCETPLDLAESMAFNVNCLGSVAWYEWGNVSTAHLTGRPVPPELKTYIRFFLDRQDLFRRTKTVADVAVLRTFAEQAFGKPCYMPIEQGLIEGHAAWRIIYDQQLDDLAGYRVVVAPEDAWLAPAQRKSLADFAAKGGRVVVSTKIDQPKEFPLTLRDQLRVVLDAPSSVVLELGQQETPRRTIVHLVNYNTEEPAGDLRLALRPRSGESTSARLVSPDPAGEQSLPVRCEKGQLTVTVPRLKIYAAVVFDDVGL